MDHVVKPIDPEALKARVAVFVELYRKIEQLYADMEGHAAALEQEIVDRKQAEKERAEMLARALAVQDQLRESEGRLERALRGSNLGTWDWNIKTGEVLFNSRWAKMRGFSPEEIRPHVDSWSSNVHSAREQDNAIVVCVSDNGPGIPPENLSKVFDRYWQGEDRKHAGTGLGVSIAKGIVEAHGGKIWVDSELGKGSFYAAFGHRDTGEK